MLRNGLAPAEGTDLAVALNRKILGTYASGLAYLDRYNKLSQAIINHNVPTLSTAIALGALGSGEGLRSRRPWSLGALMLRSGAIAVPKDAIPRRATLI
jgi:hypothetical protein